jgi:hypothetical protein
MPTATVMVTPSDCLKALRWAVSEAKQHLAASDHRQCSGVEIIDSDFPHPCRCRSGHAGQLELDRLCWEEVLAGLTALEIGLSPQVAEQQFYASPDWPDRLLESGQRVTFFHVQRAAQEFGDDSPRLQALMQRWALQRNY